MFFHVKELQFKAKPDRPNPIFANRLQEVLGGQFGEMTVMMQYLFQGFSCKGPAKYKDMLLDIGTEEIAHVEMLCTMIAHLLEGAPVAAQEQAVGANPMLAAIMGGTNPQHLIVAGAGPLPVNSVGVPWNGAYMVASGDLMADFHANLNGEIQGRLQVARLYNMTDDTGVRDMLAFMIARDTMHQNQWLAAIEELKADGLGAYPVPNTFPTQREDTRVSYQFWNMSQGTESQAGRWAQGRTPDGKGTFEYLANPTPLGPMPEPAKPHPELHNTGGPPSQIK
ncbi:MAG: manganese catalase family protein [Anaerolineae bacterium]|jgi:Mn-containing catalase|nr:manganese catalase family protein [Anaerolineae bacterium]